MKRCPIPLAQPLEPRLARTRALILYACALQALSILAGIVLAQLFLK